MLVGEKSTCHCWFMEEGAGYGGFITADGAAVSALKLSSVTTAAS